nr:PQQ-binding-like beta-propeller repeat protein [Paenibacillus sp. GSMTC-2017]
MHYASNLYALDQRTGKKLWQIDAGPAWSTTILDEKGENMTVYTPYDSESKSYLYRVRHIRLSDGKTLWTYELPLEPVGRWKMSSGDNVIILSRETFEEDGLIIVLDTRTGKVKWEKSYKEQFEILNEKRRDPYVLVQQQQFLFAVHLQTGNVQWELSLDAPWSEVKQKVTIDFEERKGKPLQANMPYLLKKHGDNLSLIDLRSGNILSRYELKLNGDVEVVDDQYVLVEATVDAPHLKEGRTFETSFYDVFEEKILWTVSGRASNAKIEGDRIFLEIDGVPSAIDKWTGRVVWQTSIIGLGHLNPPFLTRVLLTEPLLFLLGDELFHINKEDGSIKSRIHDVRFGYPEGRDSVLWSGLLNRDGDIIYLGSANGYFSKLNVNELED